jgi:hypothetical protein
MLLKEPTKRLGTFDCRALTERVLGLPENHWDSDTRRQEDYDVHSQTQSIILLFCSGWPQVSVTRGDGWDLLAEQAVPLMSQIVLKAYPPGGTVLRAMLARLPPGGRIARHKDSHPSFAVAHRIHVPLITNPQVEFIVGTEHVPPVAHAAFELNNLMFHQVSNEGSEHRIHFIFDYAGPK